MRRSSDWLPAIACGTLVGLAGLYALLFGLEQVVPRGGLMDSFIIGGYYVLLGLALVGIPVSLVLLYMAAFQRS